MSKQAVKLPKTIKLPGYSKFEITTNSDSQTVQYKGRKSKAVDQLSNALGLPGQCIYELKKKGATSFTVHGNITVKVKYLEYVAAETLSASELMERIKKQATEVKVEERGATFGEGTES